MSFVMLISLKIVLQALQVLHYFFNDRSNVEIAGKLYDEIVANVPGAIIETSAGEPGEPNDLTDRSRAINDFSKFRIYDI